MEGQLKASPRLELPRWERVLVAIERPPWHALYRVALGASIPAAFAQIAGDSGTTVALPAFFLFCLLCLRLGPTFLRRLLPCSRQIKSVWMNQRALAKRFDSYQWRKLLWIGIGLASYAAVASHPPRGTAWLGGTCVVFGALGSAIWRLRRTQLLHDPFNARPSPQ